MHLDFMYLLQCHPPIRSSIKYNTQAKRLWSIHICIDSPTEELMNKNVIFLSCVGPQFRVYFRQGEDFS